MSRQLITEFRMRNGLERHFGLGNCLSFETGPFADLQPLISMQLKVNELADVVNKTTEIDQRWLAMAKSLRNCFAGDGDAELVFPELANVKTRYAIELKLIEDGRCKHQL